MSMDFFEEQIREFEAAGNTVIGRPEKVSGECILEEYAAGSVIVFGKSCHIRSSRFRFSLGGGRVDIGDNVVLSAIIHASPLSVVSIGKGTVFNRRSELHAWEGASITVGRGCLFSNISIRTSDMHSILDAKSGSRINNAKSVIVADHVWISEAVILNKGANVGAWSVIGLGSLVTGYIPPNCIAVGRPAKVIRRNIKWDRRLHPLDHLEACEPVDKLPNLPPSLVQRVNGWLRRTMKLA